MGLWDKAWPGGSIRLGQPNGAAPLGEDGKVPSEFIPSSYVGDAEAAANSAEAAATTAIEAAADATDRAGVAESAADSALDHKTGALGAATAAEDAATAAEGAKNLAATAASEAENALASFMAAASIPLVASLAALNANLVPADGSLRQIVTVPPGGDDGVYKKVGGTGTGSWQWIAPTNGTIARNVGRATTPYWRSDLSTPGHVTIAADGNLVESVPAVADNVTGLLARKVPRATALYWRADGVAGQIVTITEDGNVVYTAGSGSVVARSATELASYFASGDGSTSGAMSVPLRFTSDAGYSDYVVLVGLGQSLRRGSFTAPTFNTNARQSARACAPYLLMPDCGIIPDGRSFTQPVQAYEDIALTSGIYESGFIALMNRFHNRIYSDTGKRVRVIGLVEAQSGTPIGQLSRGSARYGYLLSGLQRLFAWAAAQNKSITVWGVAWQHGNADYFDLSGWHYKAALRNLQQDLSTDVRLMNPTQRHDPIWFLRQCDVASSADANSEATGTESSYWHDFGINQVQLELCWEDPAHFVSTGTPNTLKVDGTHNDTVSCIWDNEQQGEIMADRFVGKPTVPFAIMPEKTRWISATRFRVVMGLPGYTLVKDLSNSIVDTSLINDTLGWRFDYYGRYPGNTPSAVAPTITALDVVAQPTRPMYGYGAVDVTLSGAPLSGDAITRCLHVAMKGAANPINSPVAPLSWATDPSAPYTSPRTPFTVGEVGSYQSGYSDIMADGNAYSSGSSYKRLIRPWLMRSLVILP